MSEDFISAGLGALAGIIMTTEFGVKSEGQQQQQQQQGDSPDLERRYRAIGIPAVNAAALSRPKKKIAPPQQQATNLYYED